MLTDVEKFHRQVVRLNTQDPEIVELKKAMGDLRARKPYRAMRLLEAALERRLDEMFEQAKEQRDQDSN
jgi:hypothetical protein